MNFKLLFPFYLIAFLLGCANQDQYTRVPDNELIEILLKGKVNFFTITYKNESGGELSTDEKALLNQGKLVRNFYRNSSGIIDQIRLSPVNDVNIFQEIRINEAQQNPFADINFIKIECKDASSLYQNAIVRDQEIRNGIQDYSMDVDKLNRDSILSLLRHCDWPTTKDEIQSLWYIIQHSDAGKMAYYHPRFKEMATKGLLPDSLVAKMEDRLLMYNGYPQLYGTQLTVNPSSFHEIKDVSKVNERRKAVGLCPIEQKAKSIGIEFSFD